MDYRLEITKKTDGQKYIFKRLFISGEVDRRIDMGAAQATFRISNTAPFSLTNFTGMDGVVDNSNKIEFFCDDELEFTGIIKNYNIKSSEEVIEVIARDDYSKLLKPIDPGVPYLIYKDIMASDMVLDLCKRAGMSKVIIKKEEMQDYKIEKEMKIKYDTQFSDVVEEAITTMEARGIMKKDGTFVIGKAHPDYKSSDVAENINYDWYYEDFIKIADADNKRNTDTLYSRILVRYNEKIYNVYEEPTMKKYLGENRFTEIETVLADTEIKRRRIANREFLNMWRRNTNLDIIATRVNKKLELLNIARIKIKDDYRGHYMVVGINTSFTADSMNEQIALEGMRENASLAVLSVGNYTIEEKKKGSNKNKTYEDVKENVSFEIDKTGKIKLGFVDIEKQPYLEVKAFLNSLLETKHYDLVIQDPNKSYYGYKQQILGDSENPITKTSLNSCESITYSGWSGQPEYFKINKPMPGRWYIYLQSDTNEEYKANISVNMPWKKVKIDEI